jgi:ABC-2 type transport system permease protein
MTSILLMARRTLKRGLAGAIFLMIGIFLFEFVQPLVADSMGGGEGLAQMMERLPPAFQSVVQARPEFIAVSGLSGYLSIGFTHPLFYVMISAAIVALIGRSIAGEIESGALELAIARPVSRTSVYVSRLIAVFITMLALIAAAIGGLVAGVLIGNPEGDFSWGHLPQVAIVTGLLMASIAGVTLASTAASGTTSQAVGRATGFIVVSFLINYLASIWSVIEPFDPISIFSWYQPADAFVNGTIDPVDAVVLGTLAVVGAAIGGIVFTRRDLPA